MKLEEVAVVVKTEVSEFTIVRWNETGGVRELLVEEEVIKGVETGGVDQKK